MFFADSLFCIFWKVYTQHKQARVVSSYNWPFNRSKRIQPLSQLHEFRRSYYLLQRCYDCFNVDVLY